MANDNIKYTTVEQQIQKLLNQNLILNDVEYASKSLHLYGYSNLIKSYREPYVITSGKSKVYRSGVSFEQVCSLYILDKNLRNAVMAAMLDLEEHIKEATADVVAKSFGPHQEQYLSYKNYRNKRKRKKRFTLPGILDTMNETLTTDKNPIYHYKTEHGIVPPWILFKSIYFSTIVNFIDLFKSTELDELVHLLYNGNKLNLSDEALRKLLLDTLYVCLEYRNASAHGGRIYNYNCHFKVRYAEIFSSDLSSKSRGFNQLLFLLSLLKYQAPLQRLNDVLRRQLSRHCSRFPQDVTYLGQILNINIVTKDVVYISNTSNKYHATPHCSGIKRAKELSLEEAENKGYIPCKRCSYNGPPRK